MYHYIDPLSITHPKLASEWSERNYPLTPGQVTAGSGILAWWKDKLGHEWQATIGSRAKGYGCPYCAHRSVLTGFNDLLTLMPELAVEWSNLNAPLMPDQIAPYSNKKVWWTCPKGHEYQSTVANHTAGNRCPYCANKKFLPGYNDLASMMPELAAEWSDKNLPLTPNQLPAWNQGSYWWKCPDCGNEYKSSMSHRKKKYSCPYCKGFTVLPGFNDLSTTDPDIAAEWDMERNNGQKPEQFFRASWRFIWWKCSKGHSFTCRIRNRTIDREECSVCKAEFTICLSGLLMILYAESFGVKVIAGFTTENGDRLEIYLPDYKIAVEGTPISELQRKKQNQKVARCRRIGINCIIIPRFTDSLETASRVFSVFNDLGFSGERDFSEDVTALRLQFLGPPRPISETAQRFIGQSGRNFRMLESEPLSKTHPALAMEWSERNFPFSADDEDCYSESIVWWLGKCGHEWKASVRNRACGRGCPYCAGKKVLKGFNDLATLRPELVSEWSEKNAPLTPDEVTVWSNRRVSWKCKKGHEWETRIFHRSKDNGCPICARDPVIPGENDLATTHPHLLELWSEKNLPLTPDQIRISYRKQVWWICKECGQHFKATALSMISVTRKGCPVCRNNNLNDEEE